MRKATGAVESFGIHVLLLNVFSSTLDLSVISTTSCYIYIHAYIHSLKKNGGCEVYRGIVVLFKFHGIKSEN